MCKCLSTLSLSPSSAVNKSRLLFILESRVRYWIKSQTLNKESNMTKHWIRSMTHWIKNMTACNFFQSFNKIRWTISHQSWLWTKVVSFLNRDSNMDNILNQDLNMTRVKYGQNIESRVKHGQNMTACHCFQSALLKQNRSDGQFHISCNAMHCIYMQYYAILCNTMQYYAWYIA